MSGPVRAIFAGGLTRRLPWILILGGVLLLVPLQRSIDRQLDATGRVGEVLYLPSGRLLRQLSLGHEGLLANIYWTRVVQYFGRKRLGHATRFDLLGSLLEITTDLDPRFLIAYRYGAIFLAERPPGGAGEPEKALQLLRCGIVANPDYWRLWQDLGFVYYWDLNDYESAGRVFQAGSERPGAFVWMKAMAAAVAVKGRNLETSRLLWSEIYRNAQTDDIRRSAFDHLVALEAKGEMDRLNALLGAFRTRQGRAPRAWSDLLTAGMLAGVPHDPSGAPYRIGPDGQVVLSPKTQVDLRLLE